jgi:hypothetical protein
MKRVYGVVERPTLLLEGSPNQGINFPGTASSDSFTESAENFSKTARIFSKIGGWRSRTTVPGSTP